MANVLETPPAILSGSCSTKLDFVSFENPEEVDTHNHNKGSVFGPVPPCSLKRKRPPKIEIPNVLREIVVDKKESSCFRGGGGGSAAPSLQDAVCATGYGVGVYSLKGKKKFMEDAHKIVSCPLDKKGFFGVYDGHGGSKAAEFVAENLHSNILEVLKNSSGNAPKEEEIKAGYLKTDQDFLKQGVGSGACCVTALIEGKDIVVSNLGDCRAVLCRGGTAEALTKDHRAAQEDERKRIEDKGGFVQNHRGAWRVHGILAVSRSIGDAHLKDWVIAEPDTKIISLSKDMEYLVLASDGLWEEVGNQEAAEIVSRSCSGDENGLVITRCPSPKLRRVSLKSKRASSQFSSSKQRDEKSMGTEVNFASENDSTPPSKARRISFMNQSKVRNTLSDQENSCFGRGTPGSGSRLVAACKELVSLAMSRGSLDDITVMIVDLNLFKD
ncbi:OLC1v1028438C1 [Oldenlandia corymbosa var. corymbosa]|uniref:protein-serine/threonine phosphatase n=1 Tax=Oldenlandia corymbosa var. corymbosa TaxID=529605 RepID=A0AAV1CCA5_OLDCO|nr:OLC1v1028438C1 [Oldenlandia corymbosa var. corymbosa]